MRSIALVALLLALLPLPVAGEECKNEEAFLGALAEDYGETLWGRGEIAKTDNVFASYFLKGGWELRAGDQLFIVSNPLGHTWTLAVKKDGAEELCEVAHGTHTELSATNDALEFEGTSGFKFWFSKNLRTGEWVLKAAWANTPIVVHSIITGEKWNLAPPHIRWQLKGPKI